MTTPDDVEQSFLNDDAPDWDALPFELHCPRCGYNVRGLPRPRCPECGLVFEWKSLIDRERAGNKDLFEYRWRRRLLRSWLRTAAAGFRPRRFWSGVSVYDPVRAGPLIAFAFISIVVSLALLHALSFLIVELNVTFTGSAQRSYGLGWRIGRGPLDQLRLLAAWPWTGDPRYLLTPAYMALTLCGAGALLYNLHQTLGRCRVRKRHILRVVCYVAGPVCLWTAAVLLTFAAALPRNVFLTNVPLVPVMRVLLRLEIWQQMVLIGGVTSLVLAPGVLLSIALDSYLRLPRAWRVGMTTAMVAALFSYTLLVSGWMILTGAW